MREREREREGERERGRERQRDRETERQRDRDSYVPVFASVPVATPELVLSLKAFDTFSFVIKKFNQLFTKFSIIPEKKIIIKYIFSTSFSKSLEFYKFDIFLSLGNNNNCFYH